jgi:hypothetical protein
LADSIISFMKVFLILFIAHGSLQFVFTADNNQSTFVKSSERSPKMLAKPLPRRTALADEAHPSNSSNRKLYLDDLDQHFGSYPRSQMENTNSGVYEMQSHNRRNAQLRQVGTWFDNIDSTVDDFRDSVSQKLDQLSFSLQKPKIPMAPYGSEIFNPMLSQPIAVQAIDGNIDAVDGINHDRSYVHTVIRDNPVINRAPKSEIPNEKTDNNKSNERRRK